MHTVRHCRAEEHSLPLRGHFPEDFLYLRSKTHIKHTISLVEHEAIHITQVDALRMSMVNEAS